MKGRLLDAVPLTTLSELAPAGQLAKLGLETIQDLLLHLPLRYEDRTRLTRSTICCRASTPR